MNRLASSRYAQISRKVSKYVAKPDPGRHELERSVALMIILRDKLGLAANKVEAKRAIKAGSVEVNGRAVSSEKYPVGFGDIIRIVESNEFYRVGLTKKAAIKLEKIESKDDKRLLKVVDKYIAKNNRLMVRLYDGSTMAGSNEINTNDSVLISGKKIESVLKFKEGAKCLVMKGAHTSEQGVIKEIKKGSATSMAEVKIESEGGSFETPVESIMIVGV
jgi:small subunit ribosomal protein S4e